MLSPTNTSAPTEEPAEPLLTVAEVAARLSLAESTVRKLAARGVIPRRKIGGSVRVLRADLERFIADSVERS